MIGIGECFSPGVSNTADFEADMVKRGIKCYLADYSVVAPPFQHDLIDFEKKFLGAKESNEYITINKWIEQKSRDKTDLILQMDIESAEYEVILDISNENLRKFRILVIEFHQMDLLLNKHAFRYIKQVFQKLLDIYDVVHIHPNNCLPPLNYQKYKIPPVLEFTFLRKDRVVEKTATKNFPHDLDRANVSGNVDYALPVMFYKD